MYSTSAGESERRVPRTSMRQACLDIFRSIVLEGRKVFLLVVGAPEQKRNDVRTTGRNSNGLTWAVVVTSTCTTVIR